MASGGAGGGGFFSSLLTAAKRALSTCKDLFIHGEGFSPFVKDHILFTYKGKGIENTHSYTFSKAIGRILSVKEDVCAGSGLTQYTILVNIEGISQGVPIYYQDGNLLIPNLSLLTTTQIHDLGNLGFVQAGTIQADGTVKQEGGARRHRRSRKSHRKVHRKVHRRHRKTRRHH